MNLLVLDNDSSFSLQPFSRGRIPPYAILSHTWGHGENEEVTYEDIKDGTGGTTSGKPGYAKLLFCGRQAKHDGLNYFWVDTCCINKSNQLEYATAINSMFRWYQHAKRCYVYLSDVSVCTQDGLAHMEWQSSVSNSRWFTRGWTLQELLAPRIVDFYSRDGVRLGDKVTLQHMIGKITGISIEALGERPLSEFSVEERLRWSEGRVTTVGEDQAYCLQGIFDVHLPLIPAEGRDNAMRRLLREIEQSTSCTPGIRKNRHWLVPRRSNPLFTGQTELRIKLKEQLWPASEDSKVFVLYGIGGVGKSEICIKFAEEHRERYWGIFWIDASSIGSAKRSFQQVAQRCGLGSTEIDDVRFWLANSEHSWLFIIDNADDPEFDYTCYFPTGSRGCIILTSRSPDCATYGIVGSEEVTGLVNDDAVQLLLTSCGLRLDVWSASTADAQRVVDALNRHTLAIIQAGAFIKKQFCNLKEYPSLFEHRRQDLLEFYAHQTQSTYRHVYATFDVSATYLEQSGLERHRRALQLLHILGFLNLDQVSESIFTRAAKHVKTVKASGKHGEDFAELYSWHTDRVPSDIMPQVGSNGLDMSSFREARAILASLSLVKVGGVDEEISMHPLVYAWVKDRMQGSHEKFRAEWEKAAIILAFSTVESKPYQEYFANLDVQITACLNACRKDIIDASPVDNGYGHLFYRLGYIQNTGPSRSKCVRDALDRYLKMFPLVKQNVLRCKRVLGKHLIRENPKHAVTLLKDVVRDQIVMLDKGDFDRTDTEHDLAVALMSLGEDREAVELLEQVVRIERLMRPKTDRDRLRVEHNLAMALLNLGETRRGVELLEQVVRIERLMQPETDGNRLRSEHNLAIALLNLGETRRGVELLEQVVRIERLMQPETDGNRLRVEHNLAMALLNLGETRRGVELLEQVVRIERLMQPETDGNRLYSEHNLAMALLRLGENR